MNQPKTGGAGFWESQVDFYRKELHKELHRRLAHEEAYQLIQRFPDTSYRLLSIINALAHKLDLDDTGLLCDTLLTLEGLET